MLSEACSTVPGSKAAESAGAPSLNVAAFDRFDGVRNRCLLAKHWRVGL
jgi:hypothetical protein